MLGPLNAWIGELFDRRNVDRTVAALVASQGCGREPNARQAMKKRLGEAKSRLRKLRTAIEAGVDPAALVESINEAQAQRAAARAELEADAPALNTLSEALRLEMIYDADTRTVDVTIQPARRGSERVRGGT